MQMPPETMWKADDSWDCGEDCKGLRLDRYLANLHPEFSRNQVQNWIRGGVFLLNGKPVRKNEKLRPGDRLHALGPPELPPAELLPEPMDIRVVHEDEDLLVVDKPKGLSVHPGSGLYTGTLVNGLLHHFGKLSDMGGNLRPGIVHRLDKDTSGLMVVAKHNESHRHLAAQLSSRSLKRTYHALVWDTPHPLEGSCDQPIGRDPRNPVRMWVRTDGRQALTHYQVLGTCAIASHLELNLHTGRTHQIRVHLSFAGHPILGDTLYGGGTERMRRSQPIYRAKAKAMLSSLQSQALHAHALRLVHPRSGAIMEFRSPLPQEMQAIVETMSRRAEQA